jgi:hypothetical protein
MAPRRNSTNVDIMRLIQAIDKTASISLNSDGQFYLHSRIRAKFDSTIQMAALSSVEEINDLLPAVLDELQNHDELIVEQDRTWLYYTWNGSCFRLIKYRIMNGNTPSEEIYV